MRRFPFILALYLLGVAITPAFAVLACGDEETTCTEMSSCEDSQTCAEENSCGNEEQEKGCSNCPFSICCTSCLFCFIEQQDATYIQSPIPVIQLREADQNILKGFSSDSWQPPEVC